MNTGKNNSGLVVQCVKRGRSVYLRPVFGNENILHSCEGIKGIRKGDSNEGDISGCDISEGDIIVIKNNRSGGTSSEILKKGSMLNRYFLQFEKQGINPLFSDEIFKEVERIKSSPGLDDPLLEDYRAIPFVTVDNDDSKDLDQAVYVEKKGLCYNIYYAIADASYYVKPGSALFRESLRRGASYYLPGLSVPMLPADLSEGIISLNEGVERRALVFFFRMDSEGEILSQKVSRCKIKSRAKLSYSGVQNFYDSMNTSPLSGREFTDSLISLQEAGIILARNGERRGVVNFDRYETNISLSEDGNSFVFAETERDDAGRWNEQMSLICNMAGASMLAPEGDGGDAHIQPVFRVHEPPGESSLIRLEKVIDSIVKIHSLDSCWIWKRGVETSAEYLSRLPRTGNEKRITETIERQILITNQRSFFTENPGEHFALKVDLYGRFSSPMREVVGIYSHKELLEKLQLEKHHPDNDDLLIREQVINSANRSRETQKAIDRFVNDQLLESVFAGELELDFSARKTRPGTILGMKDTRIYVLLDFPKIEIKVYCADIEQQSGGRLYYSDNLIEINGGSSDSVIFKAGDAVELRLLSFDDKGKWHFIPVNI